ncbi:type I-B CRISPR-associated endonuclease Cas1b [Pelotomaculum isophthalicicum JI]|uniref:CRISPR-associated endonuclease Cas1 n=1 Tax=Pelotomaculum isophthalicicum JI TaxID=947010 RepID=A0A9X4H3P0_9FIRM|nr:type I-B CRISPR-associated endonuclease Cas1b [Pelotomaculum isophthalicicum]MDF9407067.1 type I-B CRISPR-associated endonuclease Cas1b [Pelotomaculum isophthalicicum JI]
MKKTLYIFSSGELVRKDNTLCFENEEAKKFIPVEDTGEIMIFGEVTVNKKLLEFLSQREIVLHFFSHHGYYMGSFYPREHLNSGYVTLKQAEHYLDENKRLTIAREIVLGAVKNIRQVLKYYQGRGKNVTEVLQSVEKLLETVNDCPDIPSLMAIEGNIRDYYYKAFDEIIEDPDFIFQVRSRRPPKNYLNTLISFGNSLLYTICLSEIYKTHMDPRIGYLHATNFRRFTLNLDLSEVFKPIIIDRIIFTLVGKKMVTKKDFDRDTEGIMLKEKAKKCFVEELDNKLKTTISHREIGHPVSYRRLIRLELYKIEKHLIGEKDYKAFVARW